MDYLIWNVPNEINDDRLNESTFFLHLNDFVEVIFFSYYSINQ